MIVENGVLKKVTTKDIKVLKNDPEKFWEGIKVIGEGAFQVSEGVGFDELTSIEIPEGVEEIGNDAFMNSVNLANVSLPNSLKVIRPFAFFGCKFEELYIPKGLEKLGAGAFVDNLRLKKIVVDPENKFFDSRNNCNAIISTSTNTLIRGCDVTVIPEDVVAIAPYAMTDLTWDVVRLPESVRELGQGAFSYNTDLVEFYAGENLKKVGEICFECCKRLETVHFPKGVAIGSTAFKGCRNFDIEDIEDKTEFEEDIYDVDEELY